VTPLRAVALAAGLAVVALPTNGQAQRPKSLAPEEVARAVIRADSSGDWATLLGLAHPEALARFRAIHVFQLRLLSAGDAAAVDSTAVDTAATDSTIEVRWERSRQEHERFILDSMFQVPTVDSLAHTSPDTVFARWTRETRRLSAGDSTRPMTPTRPTWQVIGTVRASDTLAYVVMERAVVQPLGQMPEMFRDFPHDTRDAEVMVLRRVGREWRSMLDGLGEPFVFGAFREGME
jgi:hypothetical protein